MIQDHFGGDIAKARVDEAWHFYNIIDGVRVDLTADQFSGPIEYHDIPSNRADAFTDATEDQYRVLAERLREQYPSGGTNKE